MELFGFSAAKIITILLIAIIIFGPAQVSEMVKTVGRTIRDVRRYLNDMTKEFNDATGGLREEFAGIAQDLKGELAATQADLRRQLDLTGIFAAAAAPETRSPASPTPPLSREPVEGPVAPPPVQDNAMVGADTLASSPPTGLPVSETTALTNNGGNGSKTHATKGDPFADLAVVAASGPHSPAVPAANGNYRTKEVRTVGVSPHAPRRTIGHSVAASAYLRRKDASVAPCRGLCRSARPGCGGRIDGFTAPHAPAAVLAAAP